MTSEKNEQGRICRIEIHNPPVYHLLLVYFHLHESLTSSENKSHAKTHTLGKKKNIRLLIQLKFHVHTH